MVGELKHAVRLLVKRPGYALFAALSLALGIGATTAMFSATHRLVLAPPPYPEPDRLVALHTLSENRQSRPVSLLDLLDWQEQTGSFLAVGGYRRRSFALSDPEAAGESSVRVIQTGMVTAGFLDALGVALPAGRTFSVSEENNATPVIVLGEPLWRQSFGSDPAMPGRTVLLNEQPYTVVGVLPAGFRFPIQGSVPDAFIPLSHADYGTSRGVRSLQAVARLAPGVSREQARLELRGVAERLARAHPETNSGVGADLQSLHEFFSGDNRRPLGLLFGAAALVLLIACTNVAGLQLEHYLGRRAEVSIRTSLGATPARLGRQFLIEGLLLGLVGTLGGLVVARSCLSGLPVALPLLGGVAPEAGRQLDLLKYDVTPLVFCAVVACAATVALALVPAALASRNDPLSGLRPEASGSSPVAGGRTGLRKLLVTAQIALSLVLLAGSGLLLRSLLNVVAVDPGFRTERVLKFGLGLPETRYDERALARFHRELSRRLNEVPGVEVAGGAFRIPLTGKTGGSGTPRTAFELEGQPLPRREWPRAAINIVGPRYFETLRVPLLEGRGFEWHDDADSRRVLLVNESFARHHLGERDPLGRRLQLGWRSGLNPPGTSWEIVGIVGDIRRASLEEAATPAVYLPLAQFPLEGCIYVVRAERDRERADLAAALGRTVHELDPELQRIAVEPLRSVVLRSVGDRRLGWVLANLFAGIALLLTVIGLYGLAAFGVTQRRRELAIRLALGARRGDMVRMVLGQGLGLILVGVAAGVLASLGLGRLLTARLYGVGSADPATLLAVSALLVAIGLLASWIPARRAGRVDPMDTLRSE